MGEWKEIIIDDQFPCYNKLKGPCFTKGKGKELWVLILEKAWAKLYGSYQQIEYGLTREALHDLTGAPSAVLFMDSPDIWETMIEGE